MTGALALWIIPILITIIGWFIGLTMSSFSKKLEKIEAKHDKCVEDIYVEQKKIKENYLSRFDKITSILTDIKVEVARIKK